MVVFYGENNRLTSAELPIQPKMTKFDGRINQLTSAELPILEKSNLVKST
jgi:hypothetical protein